MILWQITYATSKKGRQLQENSGKK
jgi:hypothetical protein